MNCLKNTIRTFSNIFQIFSCDNCNAYFINTFIYIGLNKIYIYEYNDKCICKSLINKYYRLILKDVIINQNDYDFIILSKLEFRIIFDFLPLLIKDKNDLFIVLL